MPWVIAQVASESIAEGLFVEVLKVGGAPAVTLGLLWYLLTKSIPATQERFHKELAEERGVFRSELQAHREESKMQRQTYETSVKSITDTLNANHNDIKLSLRDLHQTRPLV